MEVGAALVADAEAPKPGKPGKAAFHHPPVPPEMGAALHATSRDAGLDATGAALPTVASVVAALVGVHRVRAPACSPASSGPHALHGVQRGHQHHAVVPVGPAQGDKECHADATPQTGFVPSSKSWTTWRRAVARIEATALGLDIRFVVTSLPRGSAEWIYDTLCCALGQPENLIKMHKGQLASDRTSCRSLLANQVRLILHNAATSQ